MKKLLFFLVACTIACSATIVTAKETKHASDEQYTCKQCNGTGIEPKMVKNCPYCSRGRVQGIRDCERCKGAGYIINRYGDKETCPTCDGAKKIYVDEPCAYCNGTGTVEMQCMNCHGAGTVER